MYFADLVTFFLISRPKYRTDILEIFHFLKVCFLYNLKLWIVKPENVIQCYAYITKGIKQIQ